VSLSSRLAISRALSGRHIPASKSRSWSPRSSACLSPRNGRSKLQPARERATERYRLRERGISTSLPPFNMPIHLSPWPVRSLVQSAWTRRYSMPAHGGPLPTGGGRDLARVRGPAAPYIENRRADPKMAPHHQAACPLAPICMRSWYCMRASREKAAGGGAHAEPRPQPQRALEITHRCA